jgi:flagellar hook-length control protein FliK
VAISTQNRENVDRRSNPGFDGENGNNPSSAQNSKNSEELANTPVRSGKSPNPNSSQESGLSLAGVENEKLQKQLKKIIQILEQNPTGNEIAQELQNILDGGFNNSASLTETLSHLNLSKSQTQSLQQLFQASSDKASLTETLSHLNLSESQTQSLQQLFQASSDKASLTETLSHLNLSESQTQSLQQLFQASSDKASLTETLSHLNLSESQTQSLQQFFQASSDKASLTETLSHLNLSESQTQSLQQLFQASSDKASLTETLSHLNLSESQTQKLQEILAELKKLNDSGSLDSRIKGFTSSAQQNEKLTDILAQIEQTLRRSQQGAQMQAGVSQLKQPEIVDGFVLRAEQDQNSFNSAPKIDDPRFAALLNKSTEFSSLRERQGQNNSVKGDISSMRMSGMNPQEQAQSLIQQARGEMVTSDAGANGETGKGIMEGHVQMLPGNTSITGGSAGDITGMKGLAENAGSKDSAAVDFSAAQKSTGVGAGSTDPGIMTLKSGATMPTARVVDQTIQHLNLHARGDSSVVTVKLHPEELGELNIRMVMEGDQLKLQIQAQNQQVREILEQNFPRLRTAMEDQGVTVEDFQVSLSDSHADDQAGTHTDDDLSRRRGSFSPEAGVDRGVDNLELAEITPASAAAGGLSVHV